MSMWTMIFLIVLVGCITNVLTERYRALGRQQRRDGKVAQVDRKATSLAERRELEELRDRIKVLERIATDANTSTALETRRVAEEIEALRDREHS